MISPPAYLTEVIFNVITPPGMVYNNYFVLIMEEPLRGVGDKYSPLIECELPVTRDLNWLQSVLDFNGCFIWLPSQNNDGAN